jgi:aspartate kinase
MSIIVQKYGGSSVADVERIQRVAERIATAKASGHNVVVVVSAMGNTTNQLIELAHRVSENPARRELDMLLTAGERISMALVSMALNARGVGAISLTGSQSGIITNDDHSNARIIEVRPFRIQDELARGQVVIVAGFQGVSYKREVTTLGRGGSDTTAVALAAALDAEACEIYSDVDGVYSADPRVVPAARRLDQISYEEMQELAEAGARVLNAQAVEFAKAKGIAIYARATQGGGETVVRRFEAEAQGRVAGIASESNLVLLSAPGRIETVTPLIQRLAQHRVIGKQALQQTTPSGERFSLVIPLANVPDFGAIQADLLARFGDSVQLTPGLGAVSVIGAGINATFENLAQTLTVARETGTAVRGISTSSFRISLLIEPTKMNELVRELHARLVVPEVAP